MIEGIRGFRALYARLKAQKDALSTGKRQFRQKATPWNQSTLKKAVHPVGPNEKWCSDCNQAQPRSAFYQTAGGRLSCYCKKHQSIRQKASYDKRRQKGAANV